MGRAEAPRSTVPGPLSLKEEPACDFMCVRGDVSCGGPCAPAASGSSAVLLSHYSICSVLGRKVKSCGRPPPVWCWAPGLSRASAGGRADTHLGVPRGEQEPARLPDHALLVCSPRASARVLLWLRWFWGRSSPRQISGQGAGAGGGCERLWSPVPPGRGSEQVQGSAGGPSLRVQRTAPRQLGPLLELPVTLLPS